jgi:hypothetical protein
MCTIATRVQLTPVPFNLAISWLRGSKAGHAGSSSQHLCVSQPPNPHADAVGRVVREPAEVQKERAAEAQQANAARAELAREKNEGKTKMKVGGGVVGWQGGSGVASRACVRLWG